MDGLGAPAVPVGRGFCLCGIVYPAGFYSNAHHEDMRMSGGEWNCGIPLTVIHHTPHNTYHTGTESDLEKGRTDVCTQRFNYNVNMYNFLLF
jgi:hypothetical protein